MDNSSLLPDDFITFTYCDMVNKITRYTRNKYGWDEYRWRFAWEWNDDVGDVTALQAYNEAKEVAIIQQRDHNDTEVYKCPC